MIYGLSATTLLLVALWFSRKVTRRERVPFRERRIIYIGAVSVGGVFYPLALGLGPFDPYALGYAGGRPALLLVLLLAASVLAIVFRRHFVVVVLLTATVSFSLRLGASDNLWDYMLDPWLVIAAAIHLTRALRSSDPVPNSGKSEAGLA